MNNLGSIGFRLTTFLAKFAFRTIFRGSIEAILAKLSGVFIALAILTSMAGAPASLSGAMLGYSLLPLTMFFMVFGAKKALGFKTWPF